MSEESTRLVLGYRREISMSGKEVLIQMTVEGRDLPNLNDEELAHVVHEAIGKVSGIVKWKGNISSPVELERAAQERMALLGCFPGVIYAEAIPNGYCSDYCCRHLPWFIVTTSIGHFKIGWRKRVIHLDWEKTQVTKSADELFPHENTTKSGRMIHAWSLEKAREYVNWVLAERSREFKKAQDYIDSLPDSGKVAAS